MPGMKGHVERRYVPATELRVVREDGKPTMLRGHSAVFNQLSVELWGFREKIDPGSFAETIAQDDVRALFNHNPDNVLGRNKVNTLSLREDAVGLMMEVQLAEDDMSRRVLSYIDRGDVSQQSFSFEALDDRWETVSGENIRTLKRVRLYDVGPVTFPAYPQTDVAARSLATLDVDHRALLAAVVRRERGLPELADDGERMREAARKLTELANRSSAPPPASSLDILRRRLDLAAVS